MGNSGTNSGSDAPERFQISSIEKEDVRNDLYEEDIHMENSITSIGNSATERSDKPSIAKQDVRNDLNQENTPVENSITSGGNTTLVSSELLSISTQEFPDNPNQEATSTAPGGLSTTPILNTESALKNSPAGALTDRTKTISPKNGHTSQSIRELTLPSLDVVYDSFESTIHQPPGCKSKLALYYAALVSKRQNQTSEVVAHDREHEKVRQGIAERL